MGLITGSLRPNDQKQDVDNTVPKNIRVYELARELGITDAIFFRHDDVCTCALKLSDMDVVPGACDNQKICGQISCLLDHVHGCVGVRQGHDDRTGSFESRMLENPSTSRIANDGVQPPALQALN